MKLSLAMTSAAVSALANQPFVKMNGIGNEIVVVDMRNHPAAITPADARAVAAPARPRPFTRLG